jgi:carboxyl-terminal processing protease
MLKIEIKLYSIKFFLFAATLSLVLSGANVFAQTQDDAEKQGREIFEKYQTAIGGRENLAKIKTVETISETEILGTKRKETRIDDKAGKKWYLFSEGGIEGKQETGFDGTRSWAKNNSFRGYRDNSPTISVDAAKYMKLPNEIIDGKEYIVVEEIRANSNVKNKVYYDPNTFLVALRKVEIEMSGTKIEQSNSYADYRKTGEILVSFSEIIKNNQGITITKKILSVKHNIEVNPSIFEFTDDKKGESKPETAEKQPIKAATDSKTVYKDENGNVMSASDFIQRKNSSNYSIEPEIANGKVVALKLKKGSSESAPGSTATDFSGTSFDGSSVQLSKLKGKVVVLNFWFAGCVPCVQEIPDLNGLVKKYAGKDVEFLAVTYDEKSLVSEFLKKYPFDYKIVADAQSVVDTYRINSFPTHIVLDKEGKILFTQFGLQTGIIGNLTKNIEKALGETAKVDWDRKNPDAVVPESIKKETFAKVWTTINDTYFDQTFNGVDWKALKTKYEPQLAEAKSNQDLTDLLNRMLGELKVSHLKVVPANQVSLVETSSDMSKRGSIGVDLRLINKTDLVVSKVLEKSSAEQAGIKKGYIIKKIDGQTIAEITENQRKKGGFQLRDEIVAVRAATAKFSGNIDKKVSVTFVDENNAEKTIELSRQNFGSSRDLNFESKQLTGNIGYIKFNLFFGDLPAKFAEAVSTFQNTTALIIDLRGNPGGIGNYTTALAAMIDKEKRSLGVSQYRYNKQEFDYEGSDKSYKGKVFILLDELSGSSSEVFAGGLQANKRATIIGQNSAGAVLPSTTELLPTGGALQYAIADFKTPDGKILEGRGVTPDVEVKLTRKELLAGKDTALETALKLAK